MQAALLQQSQALSTLVGHLVSQQDGGLADLSSTPGSINLSAKGAAKREKLQAALASRSGDFFLQVMQAAFKRLNPSAPCPASLNDLSGQVSICHYLERFGGFGGQREAGYVMWCLAHIADCLIQQDIQGAQEFLALTLVAVDQSVIDHGRWNFAWILTLLEDPPAQLFHARPYSSNPISRAFSPLSPVAWTTCALQYLKEIDLITTRRLASLGTGPKAAASNQQGEPSPETPEKAKRQPRYPRKPKADAAPRSLGNRGCRPEPFVVSPKFSPDAPRVDSACSSACRASGLSARHVRCPRHPSAAPGHRLAFSINSVLVQAWIFQRKFPFACSGRCCVHAPPLPIFFGPLCICTGLLDLLSLQGVRLPSFSLCLSAIRASLSACHSRLARGLGGASSFMLSAWGSTFSMPTLFHRPWTLLPCRPLLHSEASLHM